MAKKTKPDHSALIAVLEAERDDLGDVHPERTAQIDEQLAALRAEMGD